MMDMNLSIIASNHVISECVNEALHRWGLKPLLEQTAG